MDNFHELVVYFVVLGKPLIFVVNGASSRAQITVNVAVALSQHGTLAPSIIHQRSDFASSMIDGRTVMEVSRKSPSSDEIRVLWDYLAVRLARLRNTLPTPPPNAMVYSFGVPEHWAP